MRLSAALASLGVLAGYLALIPLDPAFGLLQPRGGIVMLGISLAIANGLVWLSRSARWPLATRFQLAAAGWVWIVVQAGAQLYLYIAAAA
ncbi:MAG: hypothetical protein WCY11_18875 [Novosphingobium sp.]